MTEHTREILYVSDPMCSWCWGFSPTINAIAERFAGQAPVRIVVGGLRPGTTEPMDEKSRDFIRGHWEHVIEASGQPFDFEALERRARDGFVYDTEPAARAIVVVRELALDHTLAYHDAVQKAFYADGRDVTRTEELACLAEPFGLDEEAFTDAFDKPEMREQTWVDFALARQLGVSGFPTLLVREGKRAALLAAGYRQLDSLTGPIEAWLEQGLGEA